MGRPKGSKNSNDLGGISQLSQEHLDFVVEMAVNFANKAKAVRLLYEQYPECGELCQQNTLKKWLSSDEGIARVKAAQAKAREGAKDLPLVDGADRVRALSDLAVRLLEKAKEALEEAESGLSVSQARVVTEFRSTLENLGEEARRLYGSDDASAKDFLSRILSGVQAAASDMDPAMRKRLGIAAIEEPN